MARIRDALRRRESSRTLLAAVVTAALFAVMVQQSWSGHPVTFDSVLLFVLVGVGLGSIYAVASAIPRPR
jgi:hypothetical protein